MSWRLAPDRQWLGFVQKESLGSFCRSATVDEMRSGKYDKPAYTGDPEDVCTFDRGADFGADSALRRTEVEKNVTDKDSILSAISRFLPYAS